MFFNRIFIFSVFPKGHRACHYHSKPIRVPSRVAITWYILLNGLKYDLPKQRIYTKNRWSCLSDLFIKTSKLCVAARFLQKIVQKKLYFYLGKSEHEGFFIFKNPKIILRMSRNITFLFANYFILQTLLPSIIFSRQRQTI